MPNVYTHRFWLTRHRNIVCPKINETQFLVFKLKFVFLIINYIECIFERFTWLSHVHLSVRSSVWSVLITDLNYIGTGFLTPNSAWKFLYITQIKFIWVPRPIACKSIISFLREVFNTKLSAFDICIAMFNICTSS